MDIEGEMCIELTHICRRKHVLGAKRLQDTKIKPVSACSDENVLKYLKSFLQK